MGLFSDYLEECRGKDNYIDPCMILGKKKKRTKFVSYYKQLEKLENKNIDELEKNEIREELIHKSSELERLKSEYLICEKTILRAENMIEFLSEFTKDLLKMMCEQYRINYQEICDLRQEIDKKIGMKSLVDFETNDENDLMKNILKQIINSMLGYMQSGAFGDTSSFRKVINDCAEMIKYFEEEGYSQANKDIFAYYIEREFNIKKVQCTCYNCHKNIYENIPYCLNCYERNM